MAPNYPAGQDSLNGFKRGFGKPVVSETFTKLGQLDYAAELAQLRAQAPDALFIFLPGGMGINFIKQFVGAGLSKQTQIIGPGFSADQDVIRAVGQPMLGMFNSAHWNHDFDNPASKAFVEAFRKEYKRTPSIYAAQAFDVIMMLDAAVRDVKGKVGDREAVRTALEESQLQVGARRVPLRSQPVPGAGLLPARDPAGRRRDQQPHAVEGDGKARGRLCVAVPDEVTAVGCPADDAACAVDARRRSMKAQRFRSGADGAS
jgi:hypothetical protein